MFFKREDIKDKFENKVHPEEFEEGLKDLSGSRYGIHKIFESSDEIEVNTKKGVLYCVQLKNGFDKSVQII